ncbi:MAG: alpha-N-acetylglucosaminidase TIM-barrel domain-containing protein [Armatimonadota bacterium]
MKELIFLAVLVSISIVMCSECMSAPAHDRVCIVTDREASWIVKHASGELNSYLNRIRPESDVITGIGLDSPQAKNGDLLFVVAESSKSPILDTIIKNSGWMPSKKTSDTAESFVIRSLNLNGKPVVVIAGPDGKGALNGVYHYIEHLCGAGFFPDGEQIPRLDKLPVANIDIVEIPRFKYRANLPLNWGMGVRDYFSRMWTLEDWQKHIDWMAKKKLNVLTLYIEAVDKFWGDTYLTAFPEVKQVGYPRKEDARVFVPDYRTKLMKQVYAYARERGIKFEPVLFWGAVEETYKMAHPELKYVKGGYSPDNWYIRTDQPECAQAMEKLWSAFINEFGTDHLYRIDLMMEVVPTGMDSRQVYKISRDLIRKLDPKAEVISHWNYGWVYGDCTIRQSVEDTASAKDKVVIEDWINMQSTLKEDAAILDKAGVERWSGVYWNTGWNMDQYAPIHQTMVDLIHRQGSNPLYTGMYAAAGDLSATINPFVADMMCEMSWRPARVSSAESFARNFAYRRHGSVAGKDKNVLASYSKMLSAAELYNRKLWLIYKDAPNVITYGWEPSNFVSSNNTVVVEDTAKSIKLFDEAIEMLPQTDAVYNAPFMADHRFRLSQTRLFEQMEMQYVQAITGTVKAERLAAIDDAIQSIVARKWLLQAHGRRSIADTMKSLRDEKLPLAPTAGDPGLWGWFGGYDSVECMDILRLPKFKETRQLILDDKPVPIPWAYMLNEAIPESNQ